tara:strand:+ start:1589 stop:4015 length:2427 start_codon:yes stop_codon:yes gene_type:complete
MTINVGDWVGEQTATEGTGNLVLLGPLQGYAGFSTVGDGEYWYTIVNGLNKESGNCTIVGNQLVRTNVSATLINTQFTGGTGASVSPLSLSGISQVYITFNRDTYESLYAVALLPLNNVWTGSNTFNNTLLSPGAGANSLKAGDLAGSTSQGIEAIALGYSAGRTTQGDHAVSVGSYAAEDTQGSGSVAIGYKAGQTEQGYIEPQVDPQNVSVDPTENGIAIGAFAAQTRQKPQSIAIGSYAGYNAQGARGIIISSTGAQLNDTTTGHIHITSSAASIDYDTSNEKWTVTEDIGGANNTYDLRSVDLLPLANTWTAQNTFNAGLISNGTGSNSFRAGLFSGSNNQGVNGVAIGYNAGTHNQGLQSIAIGTNAAAGEDGVSSQGSNAVAIGTNSGVQQESNAISIGASAGQFLQKTNSIAIGLNAGKNNQSAGSISLGFASGSVDQAASCIAIGNSAGNYKQSLGSIAIGHLAGMGADPDPGDPDTNFQGTLAVAIGHQAGSETQGDWAISAGYRAGFISQGQGAVSIGYLAGTNNQSDFSIAIGVNAGRVSQGLKGIIINSAGIDLNDTTDGHIHIASNLASANFTTTDGWTLKNGAVDSLKIDGTGISVNGGGVTVADGYLNSYGPQGNTTNLSIGLGALALATGGQNVGLGTNAGANTTTGVANLAIGASSLFLNSTGSNNTAVGQGSLLFSNASNNTCIGTSAGSGGIASNNTVIGKLLGTSGLTNTVLIGAGATERIKVTANGMSVNGTEAVGKNGGPIMPQFTTTQRSALTGMITGEMIYNTTIDALEMYNGSVWIEVTRPPT